MHDDVTSQRRLAEVAISTATRPGEGEFRRLLEKLPAGAYTCDCAGLITYYNKQAADLWGRAPKLNDPVDRFCGSFRLFSSDGAPINHDRCWMALALRDNAEYNGHEIIVQRPCGQRLTVLAYANPIRDEDGTLRGAVNVLVDITDRKQVEDALRAADRSKDEFLATLAHELRNPLAPLRHAVEVLRIQGAPTPDATWAVEVIGRQMEQMTRLIDDLLDVSRITRNKLALRRERIALGDALQVAVETSKPLIESCGHEFALQLPPEPLYVDADLMRLAQAVANLLNNAAKYTESGGHITLTAERQGSEAAVTVRDDGVGIAPEMLPHVFDMFTQVDRSMHRAQGGLGIGLTLVRRLVELHGGGVEAHSDGPGKGSAFVIRLPLAAEQAPAPPAPRAPGGERAARPRARPLRILVADDNRDSARSLSMLLRLTGNTVRTAYDGAEAVESAEAFAPDVALLDIGMPRMDGYDAAAHIRRAPWGRRVTLIALTGWGQDGDKQRSKDAGFDHHVVKPVDPGALMELLASLEPRDGV